MKIKTFNDDRNGRSGAKEWSDLSYNICLGCAHGCLYCYAKAMRNRRDPSVKVPGTWENQRLNPNVTKFGAEVPPVGVVMFPSSHDITPAFLPQALLTIRNLLTSNQVLIVTKPHLSVIEDLCRELATYRKEILFRFTIGALDEKLLRFWEPAAPPPLERLEALRYAHGKGFSTSVSVEPMIGDADHTIELVAAVEQFVTDTIWIGKMQRIPSKLNSHIEGFMEARDLIKFQQRDEEILRLVARLDGRQKVRWKDSIKNIIPKVGNDETTANN